jgi:hypothetical protein
MESLETINTHKAHGHNLAPAVQVQPHEIVKNRAIRGEEPWKSAGICSSPHVLLIVVKRVVWERESTAAAGGRRRAQAPRPPRVGSACRQERAPRSPRARALPQRTRSRRPPKSWATPLALGACSACAAPWPAAAAPPGRRASSARMGTLRRPHSLDVRRSGSVDFAARSALPARRVAGRRRGFMRRRPCFARGKQRGRKKRFFLRRVRAESGKRRGGKNRCNYSEVGWQSFTRGRGVCGRSRAEPHFVAPPPWKPKGPSGVAPDMEPLPLQPFGRAPARAGFGAAGCLSPAKEALMLCPEDIVIHMREILLVAGCRSFS